MPEKTVASPQPIPPELTARLNVALPEYRELSDAACSTQWYRGGQEVNVRRVREFFDAVARDPLLHDTLVNGPTNSLAFRVGGNPSGSENVLVVIEPKDGSNHVRVDSAGVASESEPKAVKPEDLGRDVRVEQIRHCFEEAVEGLVQGIETTNQRLRRNFIRRGS